MGRKMSQDNNFHQYGYDHYLKAPAKTRPPLSDDDRRNSIFNKLRSPLVATVALLVAGALFIGVIVSSYPSGDESERQIPIIKADLRPIKTMPLDHGGMSIPNRDSAMLANVGQSNVARSISREESQRIENLLSMSSGDLITKEQAIERAMERDKVPVEFFEKDAEESEVVVLDVPSNVESNKIEPFSTQELLDPPVEEISPESVLQKVGELETQMSEDSSEFSVVAALAATKLKPRYTRGSSGLSTKSPDTIDYVRGVLGGNVSNLEPAAGAAVAATNITAGMYFVQLASITDPARAAKEWSKMQARYYSLVATKYRVQEASLPSGKFYRIQAGPMSKENANRICNALKAAGKPGGCLIVK